MIKSLARLGVTLGLVGSTLVGSLVGTELPAQSLPEEEVKRSLQGIPVFMITNGEGKPLPLTLPNQNGGNSEGIAVFFISPTSAQQVEETLESQSPNQEFQTTPFSLAQAYEIIKSNQERAESERLPYLFVPEPGQVKSAVELLRANNPDIKGFNAVPLFAAKREQNGQSSYLTIRQNGEEIVPFFFEKEKLESLINNSRQSNPELGNIEIKVATLEGFISTLHESNDEQLKKIVLWPSTESIRFIEQQSQQ